MILAILERLPFFTAGEESFMDLFRDAAHWEFEMVLILLFDVFLFGLVWPFVKRHIHSDIEASETGDDERHRLLEERVKRLEER